MKIAKQDREKPFDHTKPDFGEVIVTDYLAPVSPQGDPLRKLVTKRLLENAAQRVPEAYRYAITVSEHGGDLSDPLNQRTVFRWSYTPRPVPGTDPHTETVKKMRDSGLPPQSSVGDNEHAIRYRHHPPVNMATADKHEKVRRLMADTETELARICPAGREWLLVKTKLEEAMMWANAAIARERARKELANED